MRTSLNAMQSIPVSKNFSQMVTITETRDVEEFDAGDEGLAEEQWLHQMDAEITLITTLKSLTDRQKTIFMYQILRDLGYNLRHEECAKTLGVTREYYMSLLAEVKKKTQKIIQLRRY